MGEKIAKVTCARPSLVSEECMKFLMERLDSLTCTGVFSYELKTLTNKTYWNTTVDNVIKTAMIGEGCAKQLRDKGE